MTATNSVDNTAPDATDAADPATPRGSDVAARETAEDDQAIQRITNVPRDVILPGLPGAPFLIAGTAVLTPGGPQLLTRWAKRKPKGVVHTSLKHISRWLDDLERLIPGDGWIADHVCSI